MKSQTRALPMPLTADARNAIELRPHAAKAAALLKAIANEQRLMVLCSLVGGPLTVGELNSRLRLSQSALSQHLSILREAGIVSTARDSQSIIYSLPTGIATQIIGLLHDEFCPVLQGSASQREQRR